MKIIGLITLFLIFSFFVFFTKTPTISTNSVKKNISRPTPICNDQKPGSAPVLFLATSSGPNSITLNWSKAIDPVSYYLVTFGTKPGEQLYGNPEVGDSNTTSYTINNLSGGKNYYFKVRAGNGCMPGDYSNEVIGRLTGGPVTGVPEGFAPGVLGVDIEPTKIINTNHAKGAAKNNFTKYIFPIVLLILLILLIFYFYKKLKINNIS